MTELRVQLVCTSLASLARHEIGLTFVIGPELVGLMPSKHRAFAYTVTRWPDRARRRRGLLVRSHRSRDRTRTWLAQPKR